MKIGRSIETSASPQRVWPLLVAVLLWERRGRRRAFYALACVPVTLALALSFSRGALLLGLPAALLVMGWLAGGRYRWAALALVVVAALVLIPLLRLPRFASLLDLRQGSTENTPTRVRPATCPLERLGTSYSEGPQPCGRPSCSWWH